MTLQREDDGDIAVVRIEHGKVGALDVELLDALRDTFAGLVDDGSRAVVLTGTGRSFSAGVDLPRVLDEGPEYARALVRALDEAFRAVLALPKPVVAAVNGHAIAGGCVLMCACDQRLVADGGARIGVTEMRVGVPFPLVALEIVRARAGLHAEALVLRGALHGPAEARSLGLVDAVVAADELRERSVALARELADIPPPTYALTKAQLRRPIAERLAAHSDAEVAQLWSDPGIRGAMQVFLERTMRR